MVKTRRQRLRAEAAAVPKWVFEDGNPPASIWTSPAPFQIPQPQDTGPPPPSASFQIPQPEETGPPPIASTTRTFFQDDQGIGDVLLPLAKILLTMPLAVLQESGLIVRWLWLRVLPKPIAILFISLVVSLMGSYYLSIFCHVPGVALVNTHCFQKVNVTVPHATGSNTGSLAQTNELFYGVIHEAAPLQTLPYQMTYTELALRDVRTKVLVSSLSVSDQEEMVQELDIYIDLSGVTMNKLQAFSANLLGTIDRVLINNEWTIRELDHLETSHTHPGRLARASAWIGISSAASIAQKTAAQIEKHLDNIEPDLSRLIIDARVLLNNFEILRQPLENIKLMTAEDTKRVTDEMSRLEAQQWSWEKLWVRVGGKREAMGAFGKQLDMLEKVDRVVSDGRQSLAATLIKLASVDAHTKTLRDSVQRSRDREVPDRKDLIEIAVGAQRLNTLQQDQRKQIQDMTEQAWSSEMSPSRAKMMLS